MSIYAPKALEQLAASTGRILSTYSKVPIMIDRDDVENTEGMLELLVGTRSLCEVQIVGDRVHVYHEGLIIVKSNLRDAPAAIAKVAIAILIG